MPATRSRNRSNNPAEKSSCSRAISPSRAGSSQISGRSRATPGRPVYFVLGNHDHFGAAIGDVRDAAMAAGEALHWLPPTGVVPLGEDAALVGVDGWADGRHGNALTTTLALNDDPAHQRDRRTAFMGRPTRGQAYLLPSRMPMPHASRPCSRGPPMRRAPNHRRDARAAVSGGAGPGTAASAGRNGCTLFCVSGATGAVLRRFAVEHSGPHGARALRSHPCRNGCRDCRQPPLHGRRRSVRQSGRGGARSVTAHPAARVIPSSPRYFSGCPVPLET